jgi:hypothetical protein
MHRHGRRWPTRALAFSIQVRRVPILALGFANYAMGRARPSLGEGGKAGGDRLHEWSASMARQRHSGGIGRAQFSVTKRQRASPRWPARRSRRAWNRTGGGVAVMPLTPAHMMSPVSPGRSVAHRGPRQVGEKPSADFFHRSAPASPAGALAAPAGVRKIKVARVA